MFNYSNFAYQDADIQSQGDYENKPRALVILEKVLAVTGTDDTYEEGIRYIICYE